MAPRSRPGDFSRQNLVLAALRCPKKSSRCSLARFFRPLRMLRLAASATGGAQLRIPRTAIPFIPNFISPSVHPKAPLCKGSWHGVAVTEGLPAKGNNFISPVGVAESPQGDRLHACPAGGYFSVKKRNQKSLGEDPETPTRRYAPTGRSTTSRIWG